MDLQENVSHLKINALTLIFGSKVRKIFKNKKIKFTNLSSLKTNIKNNGFFLKEKKILVNR